MSFVWADANVEQLRQGCIDSKTFAQIAAEIGGGVSRNACLGKATRLGFTGRGVRNVGVGRRPKAERKPPPPPIAKPLPAPEAAMPRADRSPQKPEAVAATTRAMSAFECDAPETAVDIVGLRHHHCRWPCGGDVLEDFASFKYCGAHRIGEGPYCAHHSRLAGSKPMTRSEAQIAAQLKLHAARSARAKAHLGARRTG